MSRINELLSENHELKTRVDALEREVQHRKRMQPEYDGEPVTQGALNALVGQRNEAWSKLNELLENCPLCSCEIGHGEEVSVYHVRCEQEEGQKVRARLDAAWALVHEWEGDSLVSMSEGTWNEIHAEQLRTALEAK